MSKGEINSLARLLADAINELGFGKDPRAIVKKVQQLQKGLPSEDEFMLLLSWLGKCRLVHKLDQLQAPPSSKEELRVPDLLAIFDYNDRLVPVLIETKVSKKRKLSWTPDYLESLRRYANLMKLPLLVAWKWPELNFWTLCDISIFEKPYKNYKLSFEKATKNSLMGKLAGDFSFFFKPGVGIHLKLEKLEKLESKDPTEEHWHLKISDAYYSDGMGNRLNTLGTGIWWLFLSAEQKTELEEYDDHFFQRFIISEESAMNMAHRLLPIITMGMKMSQPIPWRELLRKHSFKVGSKDLLEEIRAAIPKNIISYIFHLQPEAIPPFLVED
jgi:Holliday junction resolvase